MRGEIPPPHTNLFRTFNFVTLILSHPLHINLLFRFLACLIFFFYFPYFVVTVRVTLLAHLILLDPIICQVQTDISHCAAYFTHEFRFGAVNLTFTFTASWLIPSYSSSGVPGNFIRGGVQQIQLRTEDRENGDVGT